MNAIIPQNFGKLSSKFVNAKVDNDLAAGVQTGFGLIGYRGKVWSIRYRGDEKQLMRDDGDGPRGSIEVVIVKAAGAVSKIFYKDGWVEGSNAAPDCFSTNGVTPDAQSKARQANACASCPMNAWGSRVTPAGKPGKACSDSKRLAVVPLGDLHNELYGGPMLLRVPAASLNDLASFGKKLESIGYPYNSIGVRISFDPAESYPKFQFSAMRVLSDEEADIVLQLQDDPAVQRILAEGSEHMARSEPAPAPESVFEQPPPKAAPAPVQAAPAPAPEPAQKREYKKQPPKVEAPAPVEEVKTGTSFDDELDAQLNGLLPD